MENTFQECKKIAALRARAQMFQKAREFFAARGVLEVDCPALSPSACVDVHIDVMKVDCGKEMGYLHTSPEYGMKRLLSQGIGDIYQISHVFRQEEKSPLHNPEFTMVEWYRTGFSFQAMIDETVDFVHLFLGALPVVQMSYREMFCHFLKIDPFLIARDTLLSCAEIHGLDLPQEAIHWDRDTLLQVLLSFLIEPQLGIDHLFVLSSYPASQAALAKTQVLEDGEEIAHRFEVYVQGMELANGYEELTDSIEQKKRFENANHEREKRGKEPLKIDGRFLSALASGMPDCCGVAVGFDRLMLLRQKEQQIQKVIPFCWEEA